MAIVESNKQNNVTGSAVETRSEFPLSYEFFDTHRFGEYHPHFWVDGVEGDKNFKLRSSHDVRSYTLKAPLLQDVSMKKDYFMIPMEAILPFNWEKWNAIPVKGDDVSDDVGLGVDEFWSITYLAWMNYRTALQTYLNGSSRTGPRAIAGLLRLCIFGEYFFSSGSLINSMGARGSRNWIFPVTTNNTTVEYGYDEFFDATINFLKTNGIVTGFTFYTDPVGQQRYHVDLLGSAPSLQGTTINIDLHTALQLMRDNLQFQIAGIDQASGSSITNFYPLVDALLTQWTPASWSTSNDLGNYNLGRVFAYQLVCAHYYSNDHIDYIFSANLYRELIGHYVRTCRGSISTFTYNGVSYQYDYCSAHHFNLMMAYFTANATTLLGGFQASDAANCCLAYFSAIFSYKRSLRYLDYFTGTRSYPLAVGDVNIDVNTTAGNSYVSAVDVTANIQRQRLFNAVNRVGAKWENYIELMSGRKPAPDFHNPFYLGHTNDKVFGSESEYTGNVTDSDAQNVTSVLRSNGGRYEFNVDFIDRPCIIIGLTYYDLPRVYGRAFERQTFIMDRFDMFNKYLQFTGDQEVNDLEVGNVKPSESTGVVTSGTFSYQTKDMQYKQRFNQLAGGFGVNSTQLDNWLYRADDVRLRADVIDPDFIRSYNAEFDKFYLSLNGYSLGTYFHFIVRNINDCSASRPMAVAPGILQ